MTSITRLSVWYWGASSLALGLGYYWELGPPEEYHHVVVSLLVFGLSFPSGLLVAVLWSGFSLALEEGDQNVSISFVFALAVLFVGYGQWVAVALVDRGFSQRKGKSGIK
jgi:hypothetical membrane protein